MAIRKMMMTMVVVTALGRWMFMKARVGAVGGDGQGVGGTGQAGAEVVGGEVAGGCPGLV